MTQAQVRILADRVEKDVVGDVERTAEKYRILHRISVSAGFIAPDVIAVDRRAGTVSLQRIDDIASVREVYRALMRRRVDAAVAQDLWRRIGGVLATIHRHLPNADGQTWVPPARFGAKLAEYGFPVVSDAPVPETMLHGDFGFANVFVRGSSPWQIVVIDPCHDGYSTTSDWTSGPAYLDIGKMLLSLEGKVPLHWQASLDRSAICMLQQEFLEGYADASGFVPDSAACFAYAYGLADLYFTARYPTLGQLAARTLYNRLWKRNYPWRNKQRELARWAR